jgi:hypothetical protein
VALKIIQLEEDDTFEEMMIEILILQKCSDKNIVKYFGSWKKGEELFVRPPLPCPPPRLLIPLSMGHDERLLPFFSYGLVRLLA